MRLRSHGAPCAPHGAVAAPPPALMLRARCAHGRGGNSGSRRGMVGQANELGTSRRGTACGAVVPWRDAYNAVAERLNSGMSASTSAPTAAARQQRPQQRCCFSGRLRRARAPCPAACEQTSACSRSRAQPARLLRCTTKICRGHRAAPSSRRCRLSRRRKAAVTCSKQLTYQLPIHADADPRVQALLPSPVPHLMFSRAPSERALDKLHDDRSILGLFDAGASNHPSRASRLRATMGRPSSMQQGMFVAPAPPPRPPLPIPHRTRLTRRAATALSAAAASWRRLARAASTPAAAAAAAGRHDRRGRRR
eukprot:153047-Chlamydomonas_euryale.AAC.11